MRRSLPLQPKIKMNANRICGIVIFVFGALYSLEAYFIPESLYTEVLGARPFPLFIGILLSFAGLILIVQNQPSKIFWMPLKGWLSIVKLLASILFYAWFVTRLGFLLATSLLAMFLAIQFGGKTKIAIFTGLGISLCLYTIFDILLNIPLPWGDWIALFIEER